MKRRLTKLQREAVRYLRDEKRDPDMAKTMTRGFEDGTMSVHKNGDEFLFSLTDVGTAHAEGMGLKRN
jgi:hypothetical protein